MADSYIEGSFAIELLTDEEMKWWKNQATIEVTEENEDEHSSDWEFEGESIWFHGDPNLNVEAAANTCQRFLEKCRPEGSICFSWAETCSKPRPDAFGGGAVFVTAHSTEWNSPYDWQQKKQAEFANRGTFPRIDLSFSGWSRNVELTQCYDLSGPTGEDGALINLAGVSADELASKVNHGVWAIALSECLGQSSKEEIEIDDVTASR